MDDNLLTSKEYWQKHVPSFKPTIIDDNPFSSVFKKILPENPNFSCAEIGAYPGFNLCYLAKKFKYKPTAIEYRDDAENIRNQFTRNGIMNLEIINKNIFEVKDISFNVVASFGFIEHFVDYENVIIKHIEMVKSGGYLIISVPYIGGLQGVLRKHIYTDEALNNVYKTHNTKIMNLKELRNILRQNGAEILFSNYVMNAKFWVLHSSSNIKKNKRKLTYVLNKFDKIMGHFFPSCSLYSPMILTVSRIV